MQALFSNRREARVSSPSLHSNSRSSTRNPCASRRSGAPEALIGAPIIAMPRYYCDYCDTYLTHDSPSVRKQHNAGYKHKANVRTYYQQFEEQQTQSLIDQRIKEHLGQAAAFQHQVGASFNQHLMSLQSNPQRPRLPILVPPVLPIGASPQVLIGPPLLPGVRPPVLPRPVVGVPGYGAPPTVPLSMAPPGAPSPLFQMNSLPRPPTMAPPATMGTPTPTSNGTASLTNPVLYQANLPSAPTGGFNAFNASTAPGAPGAAPVTAAPLQDGFAYAQTSEATH